MAIRIAALAAFIAAGYTAAAAQDIGGRYRTECTLQTGSSCSGTAEIVMTSENTCSIKWDDGTAGLCMLRGTTLSLGYIVHGVAGLGVYEVSADGSLEGVFIDNYHGKGFGKEKLVPIR
jgi:hypothetical protein